MSKFIITSTPYFKKSLFREIAKIDSEINIIKKIDNGIFLIESQLDTKTFINKAIKHEPIFIKHMMPVMKEGKITGNLEKDKVEIYQQSQTINNLKKNDLFAVQCRIISGGKEGLEWSSKDIEVYVGTEYTNQGVIPSFSDYHLNNKDINVISILINNNNYYLGFSTSQQNLNFHCDEYRICSKKGREISRAENKLKEALTKYNIELSGKGNALDIGAAPGGWTKVLADHGYNVFAVDPGKLKPELYDIPNINHYKCRIEELEFHEFFDIIVNDMNVDPQITAKIMNKLAPTLKDNGLAIVTLKLPSRIEETLAETKKILSENYDILKINSLFHNRQEITALIKKNKSPNKIIGDFKKNCFF